jgi:antitoxin VapB
MGIRAKLFSSGRSQAVRLPKALRFEGEEVIAKPVREALDEFEPGFELQREQPAQQARDGTSGSGSDPA